MLIGSHFEEYAALHDFLSLSFITRLLLTRNSSIKLQKNQIYALFNKNLDYTLYLYPNIGTANQYLSIFHRVNWHIGVSNYNHVLNFTCRNSTRSPYFVHFLCVIQYIHTCLLNTNTQKFRDGSCKLHVKND